MRKIAIQITLLAFCGVLSFPAHAVWTSPAKVTYLNVFNSGFRFALQNLGHSCAEPGGQFYIDWATAGSKQMYALLLAGYGMGDLIAANYTCDGNGRANTTNVDVRKP